MPDFQLIRSIRSSISIQITRDGKLVVKAPILIPYRVIKRFVETKSGWIEKRLRFIHTSHTLKKKQYTEGEEFMYLGKTYKLHIGQYKEISVTDKLNFPEFLMFRIRKELYEWYILQAKTLITERVKHHSAVINVNYKKIIFSDTISKWGSCTVDNTLQFNWRLIMAPILVIDYVVVHELVHIPEKNHSKRFWSKVSLYKPAYRQYRKWLNENSRKLHIEL